MRLVESLFEAKDWTIQLLSSAKASAIIGVSTFSTGISTAVGIIPDNFGKFVSLLGAILTVMAINIQRKNLILKDIEIEKAKMSLEADRRQHARRNIDEVL